LILCAVLFSLPQASEALDKKLAKATTQISDSNLDICLPAIELLGHSRNGEIVNVLTQAFANEKRALVRRYLVDALGLLGRRLGQPTLVKALSDSDAQVRQSAVVALSSYGDTASQQLLLDRAQNEQNFAVKAHLAQALGRSKHPQAKQRLQQYSQEADPKLRQVAKEELTRRSKNALK
jgi:HEAT repeat protein